MQGSTATKRRAPPPSLSSFDRLSPYKTITANSLSPRYLTPPATNIPLSSPPPLSIADDYLNAHLHHHKTQRNASQKRSYSSLQDNAQSLNNVLLGTGAKSASGPFPDKKNQSADDESPLNNQSIINLAAGNKKQVTSTLSVPTVTGSAVEGYVTIPSHDSSESPPKIAATSLRKMSQALKEPLLLGSRRLSRISQALVAAVHQPLEKSDGNRHKKSDTFTDMLHDETDEIEQPSKLHGMLRPKSHLHKNPHLGYETPATITLRKASDAYFVVIGQRDANGDVSASGSMPRPSKTSSSERQPSVALQGFRSKRFTEHRKSLWYSLPLLSDQNEAPTESQEKETETLTTHEAIHESLSVFDRFQCPSTAAEPAVTFTDVHTAPQTFASVPYSRRRSSSTVRRLRRTSSVQIKTRSSVHEIIWREEENSSSSSSQASASSINTKGEFQDPASKIPGPTPSVPTTPGPTTPKVTVVSRSVPATPRWHLENATLQALPEENLFEWSWSPRPADARTSIQSLSNPSRTDPAVQSAPTTPANPTKRRSISKESSSSSVQSFPPLLERQNTTEWRRAPLIDLNDPMAGRVTRMWLPQFSGYITEEPKGLSEEPAGLGNSGRRMSMDGGDDGREGVAERRRRSSAHPYAPARVGLSGRVGSSIGSSSHKRMVCFV